MKQGNAWLLAAVMVAVLPPRVGADVGPRPLNGLPAMRFENLEDYPEFDFYVKYAVGQGNPFASPCLRQVKPAKDFLRFEGRGRIGDAFLIAVPRGQAAPLPGFYDQPKLPTGCLQAALPGIRLGASSRVSYRVRITTNKLLEVDMLSSETTPAWKAACQDLVPALTRSPWGIFMVVLVVACFGWLGVRLARRLFRPKMSRPTA